MRKDPVAYVVDEPLSLTAGTIEQLSVFRDSEKFSDLPGIDISEERARLTALLDSVVASIISGIQTNPSKLWALSQFVPALEEMVLEDTEAREHFGTHLEQVMDILGIENSDGLLGSYL